MKAMQSQFKSYRLYQNLLLLRQQKLNAKLGLKSTSGKNSPMKFRLMKAMKVLKGDTKFISIAAALC
jgi:hypothetical protein